MAFCCHECKIIYQKKHPNCPKCGNQIDENTNSDNSYLDLGYSLHGKKRVDLDFSKNSNAQPDSAPVFSINSQSVLNQIRDEFINKNNNNSNVSSHSTAHSDTYANSSEKQPNGGFFANLADEVTRNPLPPKSDNPTNIPMPPTRPHNAEPQPFSTQQNTSNSNRPSYRTRRPAPTADIPWRVILWILLVVIGIGLVVFIWSARHAILNGILSIISSLLPIGLIIAGVVYFFRRMFK